MYYPYFYSNEAHHTFFVIKTTYEFINTVNRIIEKQLYPPHCLKNCVSNIPLSTRARVDSHFLTNYALRVTIFTLLTPTHHSIL